MFGFGIDRKTMIIILLVFLALQAVSAGTSGILATLFTIPGVLIAITFHEFAHAFTAYKLGDETPKMQGRLNLNPLSHIDLFGFIFLILAGFGWGKPVEINPRNFDGKYSISKAEAIVAVAGPITNFILAFVFLILFYVLQITGVFANISGNAYLIIYSVIMYAITINIGLGVFNLIPLPPLDGSKVLTHFLPYNAKRWFYENQNIFYIVFLLIWITGLSSVLLQPLFNLVFQGLDFVARGLINIFI